MTSPSTRTPRSNRRYSRQNTSTPSPSTVPPSYRESILSHPYSYCNNCASPTIPDIFLYPRPAPPIPPKSALRNNPKADIRDLEACITPIEAHNTVTQKAHELYNSTSTKRAHQLPACLKRICTLLLLNLCSITIIVVALYIGTTSKSTAKNSVYWCNFTNALPRSLISAAFVFMIAVFGLTPHAQRLLSGRAWTQLLYVGRIEFSGRVALAPFKTCVSPVPKHLQHCICRAEQLY